MQAGQTENWSIAPWPSLLLVRVALLSRLLHPLERSGALQILARYLDESVPDIAGLALLGEPAVTLGLGVQAFGFGHA
jgi:hypothetical protein